MIGSNVKEESMPKSLLGKPIDPAFPDYAYAAEPLVKVFKNRTGGARVATLFLGEWTKVLDKQVSAKKRVRVRYRGGEGYVDPASLTRKRHLEIFFIDVSQGDGILIQTPEDRRILIDAGQSDDAYEFIRNKYRLDKPANYIDFEAIIATHSDLDHTNGLLKILADPKIAVKRFYHNGLFRRTDTKKDPGTRRKGRVYDLVDRPGAKAAPALTPLMKKILSAVKNAEKNLPNVIKKMQKIGQRVDVSRGDLSASVLTLQTGFFLPMTIPQSPWSLKCCGPELS